MEYGLRISALGDVQRNPAEFCSAALWELCSDAQLTSLYFGTEFCQELLPRNRDVEAFCALCSGRGLEAVLLTPPVTHRGLNRLSGLLDGVIKAGWFPTVVFNDWGVFDMLRKSHPDLSLHMGRLMNRGLRDPRLSMQAPVSGNKNSHRGDRVRSLVSSLGVNAIESDADLEPGFLGLGDDGLKRVLHLPFSFAASGRHCLEKAAATAADKGVFTHALKSGCAAPCRGIHRKEYREDTQKPMWRAGNTVFFEVPLNWVSRHIAMADLLVFHERPMP